MNIEDVDMLRRFQRGVYPPEDFTAYVMREILTHNIVLTAV